MYEIWIKSIGYFLNKLKRIFFHLKVVGRSLLSNIDTYQN
jgi:hypothetical protein